ncbi:MAG: hypothetical protein PSN36_05020 [Gammaproteobacteria bacterium]|nr:hypothetical protein [Gammaproteobacteria bacterium]
MNQTQRHNYLEALGVPDFLHAQNPKPTPKINTQCLVIETQNPHSFCQTGKTQDFLLKMLGAIGLKPSQIQLKNINPADLTPTLKQHNAKTVLLMSTDLKPTTQQHFATHHPSVILNNQQRKREAWEVLKQLKQCLK